MARRRFPWRRLSGAVLLVAAACSATIERSAPTVPPQPSPVSVLGVVTASSYTGNTPTPQPTQPPTPVPVASPTSLLGAIPTSAGVVPTSGPTIAAPSPYQIDYFQTNSSKAGAGEFITLVWSIKGAESATIYRLDTQDQRAQSWYVPRTGTLRVRIPGDTQGQARFQIAVGSAPQELTQIITIDLTCTQAWFFQPEPTGCPPGPPTSTLIVEQVFEHGWMYWTQTEKRIYVIFNDKKSPAWTFYSDDWKDGQPASDPALNPPKGLSQPVRGFGLVWRTKERVRARLGWASSSEQSYDGVFQGDGTTEGGLLYVRTRDGNVFQLANQNSEWQLIVPKR